MDMWVTGIANQYAKMYDKPVTHRGGKNLNSLNYGADKVWLDDEYGQYLLSRVMEAENTIKGKANYDETRDSVYLLRHPHGKRGATGKQDCPTRTNDGCLNRKQAPKWTFAEELRLSHREWTKNPAKRPDVMI